MLKIFFIKAVYISSLISGLTLAEESQCFTALKAYENNYQLSDGSSNEKRLVYLKSIKSICRDNAIHVIYQSRVLVDMRKVDDAFLILDEAIANYSLPIGNALYEKADLMQRIIFSGYKNHSEHKDISYKESILLFKQALKTDTNIKPLIYAGLAEVHILINELDEAIEYASLGIKLDNNIARFYSLLGIIESKKNDFLKAQHYLEISANKQGMAYLKEPDTVLALAKVFCHNKRKDLVIGLVNKALDTIPHSEDIPDLQKAYDIAKNCPHPNPMG